MKANHINQIVRIFVFFCITVVSIQIFAQSPFNRNDSYDFRGLSCYFG